MLLFMAVLLVTSVGINSQRNNSCITPNGDGAHCISIHDCPLFLTALRNLTPEVKRFLQASQCGFQPDNTPTVCCGEVAEYKLIEQSPLPSIRDCGQLGPEDRIYYGDISQIGVIRFLALLEYRKDGNSVGHNCTGVLISPKYILTTASCIRNPIGDLYRVRLGEYDKRTDPDCEYTYGLSDSICFDKHQDIDVEKAISHPHFLKEPTNKLNRQHDIALVRLSKPVIYNELTQPICLPTRNKNYLTEFVHVSGWTNVTRNEILESPVLLRTRVELIANYSEIYKGTDSRISINNNQICASKVFTSSVCIGDHGAPLMSYVRSPESAFGYANFLLGLASHVPSECASGNVPVAYTKVSEYVNWIHENVEL